MATGDELAAVQQAHHRQLLALRQSAADLVDDAWLAYAGLDDAAAARFAGAVVPIVDGIVAQTGTLAAGYLGANDAILERASEIVPTVPIIRGGTPTADVYHRSIVEARRLVADGMTPERALDAGRARAVNTARTDVMLANKQAIDDAAAARPWVVGYRRVLTGRSCALCAVASTQRYRRANLQPIHASCDCDVAEIYGTEDPGQVINRQLLRDLRAAGKADGRPDYWNGPYVVDADGAIRYTKTEYVRDPATGKRLTTEAGSPVRVKVPGAEVGVKVRQHGEVGPLLTDKRHAFTPSSAVKPTPAPKVGGKPITAADPKIQAEARRRGLDPVQLAAQRERKRVARLEEQALARKALREMSEDSPDVIAAAERHGVSPAEVMAARARVPDVKRAIAAEAAEVQAREFDRLYVWNDVKMRGPGTYKGKPPAEYDWLEALDARERARLSRKWFDNSTTAAAPDELAQIIASNDPAMASLSPDEIIDEWLEATRRYEAAGALRRGKLPSSRAYSEQIDIDRLLPQISDEGYEVSRILGSADDIDIAGHIAAVDRDLVAREAFDYLERSTAPVHGQSPYRMSFQSWEEEVRELEYDLRNAFTPPTTEQLERYAELVPPLLDEPGTSYEDLYARIIATARQAGEEVPSHARIPWE